MLNVAIDGPAGAGKSTIAKLVAAKRGLIYVDTGSMYRAMALACLRDKIGADETEKIREKVATLDITLEYSDGAQQVILNGENVNPYIRTEQVGQMTSSIATLSFVREKLLKTQRRIAQEKDVIMDGRDIGTCVLPDADVKVYLTAGVRTRALRRYNELTQKGVECSLETIEKDIEERDYRDMHREIAPLKKADDAVLLDSSDMSIEEVADAIIALLPQKA